MTVPGYQSLMLPVLQESARGEVRISDVVEALGKKLNLTDDELAEMLPSGKQTTFANRVHWAKTYLKQAGLVEPTKRAHFKISDRGKEVLASGKEKIDVAFLQKYPEFVEFQERSTETTTEGRAVRADLEPLPMSDRTPDDMMRQLGNDINNALGLDIVDRIMTASPAFFERVVVRLLLAMGYGGSIAEAGKALGRSGDDGVDGVIDQDTLGLDRIYIQAKRYRMDSSVGSGAIRDFFGSLDMHKASKGLFVTTSSFSRAAVETAEKLGKRIVLIDGSQLARLLVKFNVGCRTEETVEIKKMDEDFFE